MKDGRQKGVITDFALAALIGIWKVIVFLERGEYEDFRNISAVRLEIWCFVESRFVFMKFQEGQKKKSVTSQRDSTIISYKYILY